MAFDGSRRARGERRVRVRDRRLGGVRPLTLLSTAIGWVLFASIVMAIGSVTFQWGVLGRASGLDLETRASLGSGAARVAAFAGVGAGLGLLGVGYRQADELRFPGDPLGDAVSMLAGTPWATTWWWAVGGSLLLLVGAFVAIRGARLGWVMAAVGLVPLLVFPGLTGHANGADSRLLALALDAMHVAAAGKWIGTLGVLVLVGRAWFDRLVPAFSTIAMGAVALIVVTGAAAGWRELGSVSAYVTSEYGRVLLLKVVLFGGVALIGAINWRRLTPRLGSPDGDRAMGRSASLEFLLGQVVLLVTAVLVRTAPP